MPTSASERHSSSWAMVTDTSRDTASTDSPRRSLSTTLRLRPDGPALNFENSAGGACSRATRSF
jgi:hypothetical protein